MGLMDKLAAGIERVAEGADKAIDKGKTKVGEIQIEMQMDGLAKKLGYLVFDFYRGREVDQALRQKILDDLTKLEDQLFQQKAEAAAKAEADAAWKAPRAAQEGGAAPTGEPAPGTPPPSTFTAETPYTPPAAPPTEPPSAEGDQPTPPSGS